MKLSFPGLTDNLNSNPGRLKLRRNHVLQPQYSAFITVKTGNMNYRRVERSLN